MNERNEILDMNNIDRIVTRLSHNILEKNNGTDGLCIVGIRTRGVVLADRIVKYIDKSENVDIPFGILDITFHRDDLGINLDIPEIKHSDIPFDVNGKRIVLVDDVLFTGRTIRAAIETLMDFGRPRSIQLCVLIDRGHRELPIQADFVGKVVPSSKDEKIAVLFKDTDGIDSVRIFKRFSE